MAFPNSDCECVQGIEYFIDPRHYTPWEENGGIAHIELPWWYRNQIEAVNKRVQEEVDAANEAAKTETSASQRTITLVVKGTSLINHGFIHLVAHQIKSFWVSLETLDEDWLKCDISLQFTHVESGGSVLVPLLGMGPQFKVAIPSTVLLPGTLLITAIGTVKLGDYQVLSTESLKLRVYDPVIPPIKWPNLKSYDVYFEYQRMMKSILAEVEFLTNDAVKKINTHDQGIEVVWGVTDSNGVLCTVNKKEVVPLVHTERGTLKDKDGTELLSMPLHFAPTDAMPLDDATALKIKTTFTTSYQDESAILMPRTVAENVEVTDTEVLSERLEAIKADLKALTDKDKGLDADIEELKTGDRALNSDINTLRLRVTDLETKHAETSSKLSALSSAVEELTDDIILLNKHISGLELRVTALENAE